MLISSLLFHQKLRNHLEAIGFKVNTYGPCVAKKKICDKQMTITWNVDDLKASHADKYIVGDFIQCSKETYEDIKNSGQQEVKYIII